MTIPFTHQSISHLEHFFGTSNDSLVYGIGAYIINLIDLPVGLGAATVSILEVLESS